MEIYKNKRTASSLKPDTILPIRGLTAPGKIPYDEVSIITYSNVVSTHHGLLQENQLIEKTTVFEIYPNENLQRTWTESLLNGPLKASRKLDQALVLTHSYDANYQHFLIETLPRLHLFDINFTIDIPILISKAPFVREILTLLYPDFEFITVDEQNPVEIQSLAIYPRLFTRNLNPLHTITINALNLLIDKATRNISDDTSSDELIYLGRKIDPSNSGAARIMLNQTKFVEELREYEFVDKYFEGLSIGEKASVLKDAKVIITPIGANVMNILFARKLEYLIVISHKYAFGHADWFVDLAQALCPNLKQVGVFEDITISDETSKNGNVPYEINVEAFKTSLNTFY
ncbi:glycosyltransferase family 61 protein [Glaciecola sp. 1036]|uniref:glycosyltransferase family 61 protein n=1 Tax=Alteromonadaceae TaxID=72275 RepID=UPI003D07D4EE